MKIEAEAYQLFLYWIKERYQIWLRREAGNPKPWTEDLILRDNFFTMPYRELDKTTLWFRQNVRYPLWDNPAVLMATVIFRWFNYIPTGLLLTTNYGHKPGTKNSAVNCLKHSNLVLWDPEEVKRLLRNADGKVFTGAFNISNSGSTKPKIDRVIDDYINPVWEDRKKLLLTLETLDPLTLRNAHSILKSYPGLGGSGFMAYEIVCDLRFTYLLENARDIEIWCNMGPGAKRGLNRLLGRDVDSPLYQNWLVKMRELQTRANSDLETSSQVVGRLEDDLRLLLPKKTKSSSPQMPYLEMREIEHSLCEFDKYCRVLYKQGKSKRSYPGRC